MTTKGVASVRSPVCNLQQFNQDISHETFSNAVVRAFQDEYNNDQEVRDLGQQLNTASAHEHIAIPC